MSVGLVIQFLTGRYHATPWNHQVNEGVVEWPPSPWRILRSLVSAAYRLADPPERSALADLMHQLAQELPHYSLPPSVAGHTRHYMPTRNSSTKVFDTFLALPGGALSGEATVRVLWPNLTLSEDQQSLLQRLCAQVSYLGRAESWAELRLEPVDGESCPVRPILDESAPSLGELTPVLAPLAAEPFAGMRATLEAIPQPKQKRRRWQVPTTMLEALELDIGLLQSQGWNGVPGSQWVNYCLPPIEAERQVRSPSPNRLAANFARYALAGAVLPKATETLSLGERFRTALMSRSKGADGWVEPMFSGREVETGEPLQDHQHVWYLPEVNQRGEITHVGVYCRQPFSEDAIAALQRLTRIWGRRGYDLQLLLVAFGLAEDYGTEPGGDNRGRCRLVGRSQRWRSLTPMVLPRHPRVSRRGVPKVDEATGLQVDGPEWQVRWLLGKLGLPHEQADLRVRLLSDAEVSGSGRVSAGRYQLRRRLGKGARGSNKGYWFELAFEHPLSGPIALGYGAHFGLGVFEPLD